MIVITALMWLLAIAAGVGVVMGPAETFLGAFLVLAVSAGACTVITASSRHYEKVSREAWEQFRRSH